MKLGSLEEMNIRDVWPHEQYGFSKWLSEKDNIDILGKELNLPLTDIEIIMTKKSLCGRMKTINLRIERKSYGKQYSIFSFVFAGQTRRNF